MSRPKRTELQIALDAEAVLTDAERVMFDEIRKRVKEQAAGPKQTKPAPHRKEKPAPKPAPEAANG